jgi:hypothetical protein
MAIVISANFDDYHDCTWEITRTPSNLIVRQSIRPVQHLCRISELNSLL